MNERSRWVVDTNLLVSRLLLPGGVASRAVDHALAHGVLLVSEGTLGELAVVLARPKFDRYITREDRAHFLALLGGVAEVVAVTRPIQACLDPRDDKFLDVALAGEAKAILTGDRDLQVLDPFHGIRIIGPAEFLAWA